LEILRGSEINNHIDELGQFRFVIFREFPYLYEGDKEYERKYLSRYAQSPESIIITTKDTQGLVGVCTGIPLKDESDEFTEPLQTINEEEIFYIGEVMVRADFRGKGLGTKLLSKMLDLIDKSKFKTACFYTVVREMNHPLKPPGYKSLEPLWERFGFIKDPANLVRFRWKDIGDTTDTYKQMNVWFKKLEGIPEK
jgi:GNAT superfamily N-acetyltransferase